MWRWINHTIVEGIGPTQFNLILTKNTLLQSLTHILHVKVIFLSNFWNEHPTVGFFLHLRDVSDEMLHIEKNIHLRISLVHSYKFIRLYEQYLILRDKSHENTCLTRIWWLNFSDGLLRQMYQEVDRLSIHLKGGSFHLQW